MRNLTTIDELEVIAIGTETLDRAAQRIATCEGCDPEAVIPFDRLVADTAGQSENRRTSYLMPGLAHCPRCMSAVLESTGVSFERRFVRFTFGEAQVVLVSGSVVEDALGFVKGCGACSENAHITFDYILDEITGTRSGTSEYRLAHEAKCPACAGPISPKSLILAE